MVYLVVKKGVSSSSCCEFESRHRRLEGLYFSLISSILDCIFCLNIPKINEKEALARAYLFGKLSF